MQDTTQTAWTQLSPWLDELLALSADERTARLARIAQEDGALADNLQRLLAELSRLDEGGFMAAPAHHTTKHNETTAAAVGQVAGAYTLERLLGEGGMGAVWLAHRSDGRYHGKVAIKFLQGGRRNPALARRFAREAQLLARLEHPHIARLLDAGLTASDAQPYLVLEYVQGRPIDEWCESQNLNLHARLVLLLAVMDAVTHAHGRLVLHRDLKPSNILVNTEGQVKLLDFGIARLLVDESNRAGPADSTDSEADLTRVGGSAYTPRWASPEQVNGGELTPASDVFALGLLMHRLLTGLHPLGPEVGSHPVQQMRALQDKPAPLASAHLQSQAAPPDPAQHRARVRALRGDLDTIIAKALKPVPTERYRSAAELADDLRRHLRHEPILARPDSAAYRTRRFLRRHWVAASASTAVACALVAGGTVALLQAQQAQAERAKAESLLEYMLGELRDQLEPLGQLPLLDGVGQRAQAYYAAQPLHSLDDDDLIRRSEALRILGRIAQERGRNEEMAQLAEQARVGSALLLQRRPESPAALKISARSLSLLAWAEERQSRHDISEAHYQQALSWATQALAIRPDDPELQLTLADIQGELAAFYSDLGSEHADKALDLFEREYTTLIQLAPQQSKLWQNAANNRAWVAEALYVQSRYEASLAALRQQRQAQARLPGLADKPDAQWESVLAMNRESGVLLALARVAEAEAVSAQAVSLGARLVASDPSNTERARYNAIHLEQHASTLLGLGRRAEAVAQLKTGLQRLHSIAKPAGGESAEDRSTWLRLLAALARLQPQDAALFEALQTRLNAEMQRPGAAAQRNESFSRDLARAFLAMGQVLNARARPDAARQSWLAGLETLNSGALRQQALPGRVDLLLALGRRDEARAEAQALRASGWLYVPPAP